MQLSKDLDHDRQELAGKKIGLLMVRKMFDRRLRRLEEQRQEFEQSTGRERDSVSAVGVSRAYALPPAT